MMPRTITNSMRRSYRSALGGQPAPQEGPAGSVDPMTSDSVSPPVARRVPHVHEAHGDRRPDDYHWLRDRDDPEVTAYLEAENAYTDAVMATSRPLQEKLFDEIVARIQETDLSVPVPDGPFLVLLPHRRGAPVPHPLPPRRPRHGAEGSPEQILLDENVLAEGEEYCALGAAEVSPDHRLLAWSLDTEGDEDHVLRIRDLDTARTTPRRSPTRPTASPGPATTALSSTPRSTRASRPWRVWRHRLGTTAADDVLVHPGGRRPLLLRRRAHQQRRFLRDRPALSRSPPRPASCGLTTRRAPSPWSSPAARASSTASTTTATASSSSPTTAPRTSGSSRPRWRSTAGKTGAS